MKNYQTKISISRVGVQTAPNIPHYHPNVRFLRGLYSKTFLATNPIQARQTAIELVENPNTPELQKVLDSWFVPFKTLEWNDWQDPVEPEEETQIHSCSSLPFLVGVFKWIVIVFVYEV